jgi:hypothetical protein
MQKSLRPQGSPPQTQMALDMMRYVQRTGMHTTFADEACQMRPTYMVALEESFVAFKTKKLGLLTFWSAHEEILGLCLPMVELRKLFAAEGKWSSVAHELAVVSHSCSLGKKMFGFAQDKMVADLKNDAMAAFSDRLFNANTLDQKTFSEACDACNVQLDGIIGLEPMSKKEYVNIPYRGSVSQPSVVSYYEEQEARYAAILKARATETGKLEAIIFENELATHDSRQVMTDFDEDQRLYKDAVLLRKTMNEFIRSECVSPPTGTSMKTVLGKKQDILLKLDRTALVDCSFMFGMVGAAGELRLFAEACRCLPNGAVDMVTAVSLRSLKTVMDSPLFSFCGTGAQARVIAIRKLVSSIHNQCRPDFGVVAGTASEFLKVTSSRLAFFAKATDTSGAIVGEVYGLQALKIMHAKLKAKNDLTADLTLADLTSIGRFHWLLNPEQLTDLKVWTLKLVGRSDIDVDAADEPHGASTSSSSASTTIKKDCALMVNSWF